MGRVLPLPVSVLPQLGEKSLSSFSDQLEVELQTRDVILDY